MQTLFAVLILMSSNVTELELVQFRTGVAVSPQTSVIWVCKNYRVGWDVVIAVAARTAGSLPSAALCLPRPA